MANEITKQFRISAAKNGVTILYAPTQSKENMAGDDMIQNTQIIGTSSEVIDFGEITGAPGLLILFNTDPTNFIEIGGDSGLTVHKQKIPAGKEIIMRPTSGTLYAIADTAPCRLLIWAAEA
jgi:hypothetical protein